MEESQIFPAINLQALKKFKKPVTTARIVTFSLFALSLAFVLLGILVGNVQEDDSRIVIVFFGILAVLYLALAIISIRLAFVPLLLAAIISACVLLMLSAGLFVYESLGLLMKCGIIALSSGILLLQVRGVIFAKRYTALLRENTFQVNP